MDSQEKKILKLIKTNGIISPKEIEEKNISRQYVYRLCKKGKLKKISRGLYKLPNKKFSENEILLEVAHRMPNAIICLLTALRFHNMTVQNPFKIWIAIHHKAHTPKINMPIKIIRMTGEAFTEGNVKYNIDNMQVNIYNPAKTVADCFKFRNKIGMEVVLEALREYIEQQKGSIDELWKYAKIDRVHNIIRPYIEAQI